MRVRGGGVRYPPPGVLRGGVANKFCSTRGGVYHVSRFVKEGGGPVLCIQYGYQIEGFVLLLAKNWLTLTYLAYFKSSG